MTQANDVDIQELKDLIARLDKKIEVGFANVDKKIDVGFANVDKKFADVDKKIEVGFAQMKGELSNIDTRLKLLETTAQKLPDLAEKVGELKNWKQIAIVIFTATVGGAIGWLVKAGK